MIATHSRPRLPWLIGIVLLTIAVFLALRGSNRSRSEDPNNPSMTAAPPAKSTGRPVEKTSDESVAEKTLIAGDESVTWRDPSTDEELKVRRTLKMTPVVRVEEGKETATGEITIHFQESADRWNEERSAWLPMREKQYARFRRGDRSSRIEFTADASIMKKAGIGNGPPVIESQTAFGTRKDRPLYDPTKAENGMSVFLDWKGDELTVRWGCSSVAEKPVETVVVVPFSDRFR